MFCKNCGNQMNDSADFCPNCGSKNERKSINGKRISNITHIIMPNIKIIIGVLVVVGIVFVGKFLFFNHDKVTDTYYVYVDEKDKNILHLTLKEIPGETYEMKTIKIKRDYNDVIEEFRYGDEVIDLNNPPKNKALFLYQYEYPIKEIVIDKKLCLDSTECMFMDLNSLTNINLDMLDTSNVTSMRKMFSGCSSLTDLNLNKWDTSKVTSMEEMFSKCSSLSYFNANDWDTSKVENMYGMFLGCSSLTNLDLNKWDTSNVTNMSGMFNLCSSLKDLYVDDWETSNVTSMYGIFDGCKKLNYRPEWYY